MKNIKLGEEVTFADGFSDQDMTRPDKIPGLWEVFNIVTLVGESGMWDPKVYTFLTL